jgi:hypothetical protein
MGDMSGEYAGHGRIGTFSFQELCKDTCEMGPCIMLKHEVMAADELQDKGPPDFVTVSLCH